MSATLLQRKRSLLRRKLAEGYLVVSESREGPYKKRLFMLNPITDEIFIMPDRIPYPLKMYPITKKDQ